MYFITSVHRIYVIISLDRVDAIISEDHIYVNVWDQTRSKYINYTAQQLT